MLSFYKFFEKRPWLVLVFIILFPIVICFIVSSHTPFGIEISGSPSSWIGFYGNYFGAILGAIIGASIALFVFNLEKADKKGEKVFESKLNCLVEFATVYYQFYEKLSRTNQIQINILETRNNMSLNRTLKINTIESYTSALSAEIRAYSDNCTKIVAFMLIQGRLNFDNATFEEMKQLISEINEKGSDRRRCLTERSHLVYKDIDGEEIQAERSTVIEDLKVYKAEIEIFHALMIEKIKIMRDSLKNK